MRRIGARVFCLGLIGAAVFFGRHVGRGGPLEAPPAVSPAVKQLIEQLGDESFEAREAASEKLAKLGIGVKPALTTALEHDDPEVRLRARRLLGRVMAEDHAARLKAFIADTAGNGGHRLPGWERYGKLVGYDALSRSLFAEMQKAEPALLETAAGGGDLAAESLRLRCYQLMRGRVTGTGRTRQRSLGTIAAVVFVAGDRRAKTSDATLQQVYSFINQTPFRSEYQTGKRQAQARKLLGGWIERCTGPASSQRAIPLALQWNIRAGLVPARVIAADKSRSGSQRYYSLLALGKFGGDAELELLQSLLTDRTVCYNRSMTVNGKRVIRSTETRDVALAMLVHLTGQDHKDYGLNNIKENTRYLFTISSIYFDNDAARQAALKRWKQWASKNPLKVRRKKSPAEPKAAAVPVAPRGGLFIGGVRAPFIAVPGKAQPQSNELADGMPFYTADRDGAIRLSRARQLLEAKQYSQAVRLLDEALAQEENRSFQPDFSRPIFQSLHVEAWRMLSELDADGRRAYEIIFGTHARRLVERAADLGDADALHVVSRRYFHTKAGQEATMLWGNHLLDVGRPLAAAITLVRLKQADRNGRFEPMLSLRLASAWLRAGMEAEARAVLGRLARSRPRAKVEIAGRPLPPLDEVDEVLAVLHDSAGTSDDVASVDADRWPLFRGDAQRNAASDGDDPWLRSRWQVHTARHPAARGAIDALQQAYRREQLSVLPAGHLLAAGDVVLARTTGELLALDPATGRVKWRAPFNDAVDELLAADDSPKTAESNELIRGLDERLWGDATYGMLSSHGRTVYLIEDVGLAYGFPAERMIVRPDGSRRLDAGWPGETNRVTAYDIHTGKFRWEIGGPRGEFQLGSAGTFFFGPPLPLAGRLYAVGEVDRQIYLFTLDADTGEERARQRLSVLEPVDARLQAQIYGYGRLPQRLPRRMCGASPSFGSGVLVCPTSGNSFAAVDLATQSMLWSYRPMQPEVTPRRMPGFALGLVPFITTNSNEPSHRDARWADCSATISGGRVLLTPRQSHKLYCLELRTGRLLWDAPRLDSQYVAGVHDDTVLLVGRGTVRGLRLADGAAAWQPQKLPPGAAPSGCGYRVEGRYYLPLATAEVAVVDIASGRLLKRSKSRGGHVPGNLICYKNHVISQGVDTIEAFDRLDVAVAQTVAKLRVRPSDPALLAQYGELLSFSGRYAEAITQLRRSLKLRDDADTRAMLCDTVLESLRSDFAAFHATAEEVVGHFERADRLPAYYRAIAEGHRRTGERLPAFEAYLRIADLSGKDREMEAVETALSTRRDVWLQGQFADLRTASTAAQRAAMDLAIHDRLAKAVAAEQPPALRSFVILFAFHPVAEEAREQLVRQVFDTRSGRVIGPKRRPLRVEQYLLQLAGSSDPARSRAATAQLARMMTAYNRPEEAAVLYQRLRTDLADVVCLDGKTGRQLFDALPADSLVRRALNPPTPWPVGEVKKETNSNRNTSQRRWPLNVDSARNDLFDLLQIEMTSGSTPQKVEARDAEDKTRWSIELKAPNQPSISLSPSSVRARTDGHLMVLWQNNRLYALDTLAGGGSRPAVLWTKDLTTKFPGAITNVNYTQRILFAGGAMPLIRVTDPFGQTRAELGPVSGRLVCFQRMRHLTVVDPYTGETLWTRHDVPRGSQVLGDEQFVLVVPPDSTEARVYRAVDGQEVRRCELPESRDRVATIGRYVITWTGDDEQQTLRATDPALGRELWRRDFPAGAKMWRVGLDEISVLDKDGRLLILRVPEGKLVLKAKIEPQRELLDIFVLRSGDRYVLLAKQTLSEPAPKDDDGLVYIYPISLGGRAELLSGKVYGFDRASGKLVWNTTIRQQGFDLSQPAHLPVLFFGQRTYYRNNTTNRRYEAKLLCLDKRTGRVVFQDTLAQSISRAQIVPDAANHAVEIRTNRSGVKLTFTGEK